MHALSYGHPPLRARSCPQADVVWITASLPVPGIIHLSSPKLKEVPIMQKSTSFYWQQHNARPSYQLIIRRCELGYKYIILIVGRYMYYLSVASTPSFVSDCLASA
jgi:hypothetical protein